MSKGSIREVLDKLRIVEIKDPQVPPNQIRRDEMSRLFDPRPKCTREDCNNTATEEYDGKPYCFPHFCGEERANE